MYWWGAGQHRKEVQSQRTSSIFREKLYRLLEAGVPAGGSKQASEAEEQTQDRAKEERQELGGAGCVIGDTTVDYDLPTCS